MVVRAKLNENKVRNEYSFRNNNKWDPKRSKPIIDTQDLMVKKESWAANSSFLSNQTRIHRIHKYRFQRRFEPLGSLLKLLELGTKLLTSQSVHMQIIHMHMNSENAAYCWGGRDCWWPNAAFLTQSLGGTRQHNYTNEAVICVRKLATATAKEQRQKSIAVLAKPESKTKILTGLMLVFYVHEQLGFSQSVSSKSNVTVFRLWK